MIQRITFSAVLGFIARAKHAAETRDDQHNQEQNKKNLCDTRCCPGKTAETEDSYDESQYQKRKYPVEHDQVGLCDPSRSISANPNRNQSNC